MICLIAITLTVLAFATFDWWWLNVRKKYIYSHVSRWCLRALSVILIGWGNPANIIAMGIFFASTFDNTLNLMRGIEMFYLGDTAWWDKFWSEHKFFYICFITLGLFISIYILLV